MSGKSKYPLRGVVVSLNTPFDEAGGVDFLSLQRAVERHLAEGALGFLAAAHAGEAEALCLEERLALLVALRELTKGRARLFVCATSQRHSERIALAEAALRHDSDGVLVEAPVELRGQPTALRKWFREFARIGMPLLIIQDLDWNGWGLEVGLIQALFEEIPSFRCLKVETVPAGPKYSAVLQATGGRLHVSGGWAAEQMIEALDRGVDAVMNTAMTAWYRRIFEAYDRGDRAGALACFHKILPLLAFTRQHLDISIQFYKRLFVHRGLFRTARVRAPRIAYDAWQERCGRELIEYLDALDAAESARCP